MWRRYVIVNITKSRPTLLVNEIVLERIELLILEAELINVLLIVDMLEFNIVKPLAKLLFVKLILSFT